MLECHFIATPMNEGTRLQIDMKLRTNGHHILSTICVESYFPHTQTTAYCISYVHVVNRFMNNPQESQLKATKHIFQYIKGTIEFGIFFPYEKSSKTHMMGRCTLGT
jgi:hypothetical protein